MLHVRPPQAVQPDLAAAVRRSGLIAGLLITLCPSLSARPVGQFHDYPYPYAPGAGATTRPSIAFSSPAWPLSQGSMFRWQAAARPD